ncbi:MAG: hypothetical protein CBHOC_2097 [uncultured Caballeronia sp.]|nr:MAG: hypothetical protein CBHOC_2097 [uncultured Caballeronia sp.]
MRNARCADDHSEKTEEDVKPGLRRFLGLALVVFLSWPDTFLHYFAQGVITDAPWTGT